MNIRCTAAAWTDSSS